MLLKTISLQKLTKICRNILTNNVVNKNNNLFQCFLRLRLRRQIFVNCAILTSKLELHVNMKLLTQYRTE